MGDPHHCFYVFVVRSGDGPGGVCGTIGFEVHGIQPGGTVEVDLMLHESYLPINAYLKYGPTPDDHQDHWYEFPAGGVPGVDPGAPSIKRDGGGSGGSGGRGCFIDGAWGE